MSKSITNTDDIIDSRDVIERLSELEEDRDRLLSDLGKAEDVCKEAAFRGDLADRQAAEEARGLAELALDEWDDAGEFAPLTAFAKEAEGYCDWPYGAVLVRDSYFKEYAKEVADDIGATGREFQWPLVHIDWEAAAEQLQQDYTDVDFDGVTYWMR